MILWQRHGKPPMYIRPVHWKNFPPHTGVQQEEHLPPSYKQVAFPHSTNSFCWQLHCTLFLSLKMFNRTATLYFVSHEIFYYGMSGEYRCIFGMSLGMLCHESPSCCQSWTYTILPSCNASATQSFSPVQCVTEGHMWLGRHVCYVVCFSLAFICLC